MKSMLNKFLKVLISRIVFGLSNFKFGRFFQNEVVNNVMHLTNEVTHNQCKLKFVIPNNLNFFRSDTFSTKEPETLDWIDSITKKSVLWDIGANVGLYSIYAAKKRDCDVYAFEPSVFNLELLARNIFINDLVNKITIIPLPLSESLNFNHLNMSSTEWGGALSTFGEEYGHDGKKLSKIFRFSTIGISMVDAFKLLKIPKPNFIKMDVDGIEHLILKGGLEIISGIDGLLIEGNDDFKKQAQNVSEYLTNAGLVLKHKKHSNLFDGSELFDRSYNQIWLKKDI